MSTTLASLSIKKKITAVFANGTSRMNLGIPSVLELLDGGGDVPVTVSGDEPGASQILRDLAAQANRKITCAPDGLLLTLPVSEPVVEPVVEPVRERNISAATARLFCAKMKQTV